MGREANTSKDRTCSICGDIRLRTAKQMRDHYNLCFDAWLVEQRLKNIGMVGLRDSTLIVP